MTLAETIQTLKIGNLAIHLKERAILMQGADTLSWLQGQITQDIALLDTQGYVAACLCNPTGQLLTTLRIYRDDAQNGYLITTLHPQILLDRIENFVIMEDVAGTLIDQPLYSVQGHTATGGFANDRTGYGGYDTLENPNLPELPAEHLDALEIAAGIPRFGVDTTAKTLPPELGPAFESGNISYTKGCYVGQEVLQRIHSRGHTNKTWVGLVSNEPLQIGTCTLEGKEVGTVHRTAHHPQLGYIASATLKNTAIEPGTQVQVGNVTATVKPMPLLGN